MPYVLSPIISENCAGMWFEGAGYEKKNIYSIEASKLPPVYYDEHILRPHSLTHLETPAHTVKDGKRLCHYYQNSHSHFFGKTIVIRLKGNNFKQVGEGIFHWVVSQIEIQDRLESLGVDQNVVKLLVTTEEHPENHDGYHDPNYVLTLSQEAADYLVSFPNFEIYGTTWKSSDFNPGRPERPIHDTLFQKALILENLRLIDVPEGVYFMSAFPLPLREAAESPVVPVLFTKEEIFSHWGL